jgi:hypothetical protein
VENEAVGQVVLSRAVASKDLKAAEDAIADGANLGVELIAKVSGRVTRGETVQAAGTASLLTEVVIAELVRRLGITRDAFEFTLREIAQEMFVDGKEESVSDRLLNEHPELLGIVRDIKREIVPQLPTITKRGPIKVVAAVDFRQLKVE